ncbi:Os08g0199200, partial [Oryza sativa Japonica Group]
LLSDWISGRRGLLRPAFPRI